MQPAIQPHWERARDGLAAGHLVAAQAELEAMRALAPDDTRTQLLAARIAWLEDHPRDAAAHVLDAARTVPTEIALACDVVETLLATGETAAARELLKRPAWQHAATPDAMLRLADFHQRLGQHAQALAALDRLSATHAGTAAFHWYRGQQLEFLGQLEAAATAYTTCLALAPGFGQAAYQWVRLGLPAPPDRQRTVIEAGLHAAEPGSAAQADFEFAHYHVLEARGQMDAAWHALAHANAVMHAHVAAELARQSEGAENFLRALGAQRLPCARAQPAGACPIFVLGLPRSGTTVLERMLGNHSQVASAGELTDFGQQLLHVADTRATHSPAFFAQLPALDSAALGRHYLAQTAWRAAGRAYFIDKQPANWMLAGLIHAALPEAKILHLVRDPMDVCFSIWRARFSGAYAWSYDLATLAAHHAQYRALMRRWHTLWPGVILDVAYADLVRNPDATLRAVFAHCGLAWEPGCENLTRNAAPVCTLSAAQVRQPVHTRALGQWHRYARQLEPMRRRLEAAS